MLCGLHLIWIRFLQAGVEDMDVIFVGCLPIEVDPDKQEVRPFGSLEATGIQGWILCQGIAL